MAEEQQAVDDATKALKEAQATANSYIKMRYCLAIRKCMDNSEVKK